MVFQAGEKPGQNSPGNPFSGARDQLAPHRVDGISFDHQGDGVPVPAVHPGHQGCAPEFTYRGWLQARRSTGYRAALCFRPLAKPSGKRLWAAASSSFPVWSRTAFLPHILLKPDGCTRPALTGSTTTSFASASTSLTRTGRRTALAGPSVSG